MLRIILVVTLLVVAAGLAAGPLQSSTPVLSASPVPAISRCAVSGRTCSQVLLRLLNRERLSHGIAPLTYDVTASLGTISCPGAYGHSVHMAMGGGVGHDQFPRDVCGSHTAAGENVGEGNLGSVRQDLQWIHSRMLAEPWKRGCLDNHHCTIDYPGFHRVGIGVYVTGTTVWVTEDFLG